MATVGQWLPACLLQMVGMSTDALFWNSFAPVWLVGWCNNLVQFQLVKLVVVVVVVAVAPRVELQGALLKVHTTSIK